MFDQKKVKIRKKRKRKRLHQITSLYLMILVKNLGIKKKLRHYSSKTGIINQK